MPEKHRPIRNSTGGTHSACQVCTAPSRAATIRMAVPLMTHLVAHHSISPARMSCTSSGVARIASYVFCGIMRVYTENIASTLAEIDESAGQHELAPHQRVAPPYRERGAPEAWKKKIRHDHYKKYSSHRRKPASRYINVGGGSAP